MSHPPKAQEKARKNTRNRLTVPSVATETISTSVRSPSKGLTPGPLLSSMMYNDDDDDDEEPLVKICSESSDTTEQNFNLSARPTMSPTPTQGPSVLSPTPPMDLTPVPSVPPVIHSLLSDDDGDDRDSNDGDGDHTPFPLFSADDVRKKFALSIRESHNGNVISGRADSPRTNDDASDDGDNDDDVNGSQGEMVGPGYATPPRHGGSSSRLVGVGSTDQERKRAWSQVEQAEQELQEEEAAAILASEKRQRRRKDIMDAKRSFLDLD